MSTPYESAAAPRSHSVTDPAKINVVCHTKPDLPNQTDSNAALLLYLTHQLGLAHEWSGVWNGPKFLFPVVIVPFMWIKKGLLSNTLINNAQLPFSGIPVGSYINWFYNITKSWSCSLKTVATIPIGGTGHLFIKKIMGISLQIYIISKFCSTFIKIK